MELWAKATNGPAEKACRWGHQGAPMGIEQPMTELDELWPPAQEDEEPIEIKGSEFEYKSCNNLNNVEHYSVLKTMINDYVAKGICSQVQEVERRMRIRQWPPSPAQQHHPCGNENI